MQVFVCIIIILLNFVSCNTSSPGRYKRRTGVITTTKIDCKAHPTLSSDLVCRLYPINRKQANITFGFTLLESQEKIYMRLIQWQKMNSNRYMPGFVDITTDICAFTHDLTTGSPSLFKTYLHQVLPNFVEMYKDLLHPCPYTGRVLISLKIERESHGIMVDFLPPADYKTEHIFFNGKNQTFFEYTTYSSTK